MTFRGCKFFCECVPVSRQGDRPRRDVGLKPNGVYNVYRPKSEIAKKDFIESLNAKPLLDDHHVIGNVGGMASPDTSARLAFLPRCLSANELIGRIDVWSPSMLDKIRRARRSFRFAYSCSFTPKRAVQGEKIRFHPV